MPPVEEPLAVDGQRRSGSAPWVFLDLDHEGLPEAEPGRAPECEFGTAIEERAEPGLDSETGLFDEASVY